MKELKKKSIGLYFTDEFGETFAISKTALTQLKKLDLTPGGVNSKPIYKIKTRRTCQWKMGI